MELQITAHLAKIGAADSNPAGGTIGLCTSEAISWPGAEGERYPGVISCFDLGRQANTPNRRSRSMITPGSIHDHVEEHGELSRSDAERLEALVGATG
jgi:hypothetical protein